MSASTTTDNGLLFTQTQALAFLAAAIGAMGAVLLKKHLFGVNTKPQQKYVQPDKETQAEYRRGGEGVNWVVEPDGVLPVRLSKKGTASIKGNTVFTVFERAVKTVGDTEALRWEAKENTWESMTWKQYHAEVMQCARACVKLGVKEYESVNIIGFNSVQWFVADLAAIACGAKAAGIYPTNNPPACHYITRHSEAAIVFVENEAQLSKYYGLKASDFPNLRAFVVYGTSVPQGAQAKCHVPVYDWPTLMNMGADKELQHTVNDRIAKANPGQCCTLIYTSGTTGNPKAVMISHDNLTWTAQALQDSIFSDPRLQKHNHAVSYLPLSHIAAQMLDLHAPMCAAANNIPYTTWFARPDALKGSLGITLKAARPTVFLGVPRVWEKMEEKMKEIGSKNKGAKKLLGDWAKGIGADRAQRTQLGGDGGCSWFYPLAKSLIFSKVRAGLGFDRLVNCYTSAAPIGKETLNYFGSLDIHILELYGMSECTGPQNISMCDYRQVGAVGPLMPGTEIKIDHVDKRDKEGEGEICFRGRHIMMGYLKERQKTREVIDEDGWLHSGDVGRLDKFSNLFITGRIKELLITAGGENVAPVPVEDALKETMPAISNAMMVGDRKKFNTCLLTLRTQLNAQGEPTNVLAGAAKDVSEAKTVEEAMRCPKWQAYITKGIATANSKAVSNAQKVQKFTILPVDFSIAGGELTATLKLRRAVVAEMYQKEIEAMYAGSD